jgi:hypothetical protein
VFNKNTGGIVATSSILKLAEMLMASNYKNNLFVLADISTFGDAYKLIR